MTELERSQAAYNVLLNRYAQATVELCVAKVDADAEKARADALQVRLDALAPKEAAAAE